MSDSDNMRRINFDAPEAFYQRLQDEKLARGLTIQQICMRALERYLAVHESIHAELESLASIVGHSVVELAEKAWTDTLADYRNQKLLRKHVRKDVPNRDREMLLMLAHDLLEKLPNEKVRTVTESLKVDARYYPSSRVKPKEA